MALLLLSAALLSAALRIGAAPQPMTTPGALRRIPPGDPQVVSILYRFFDWGNDWQKLNPEYGPVGAVHFHLWEDWNPTPDVYAWWVIDRQLYRERSLRVTLPDGSEIPKPVVVQIFPYISSASGWQNAVFYDATPQWVYDLIDAQNPGDPRPVVNGRKVGYKLTGCNTVAVLPMYDNPIWQEAYFDAVRALGARYNDDPQISSVVINTGLDGETQLIKDLRCNWQQLLDIQVSYDMRAHFLEYVYRTMDVYREAFPDKAIFINNAPGGSAMRLATSEYAASLEPPVGLKHSGMWVDLNSHHGYGNFVGLWDMVNTYSMTLPIWLESAYGFGSSELKYWSLIAGLHYHPDAMNLHPEYFPMIEPKVLRWVGEHLGRTLEDTPSVWTVLRDAEFPLQVWDSGAASGKMGDWTFWLYRRDLPGGQAPRVWREELPAAAQEHIYSRQTRRTDQAEGQRYMIFEIDAGYPYVGQPSVSATPDGVSYIVRVILLNHGQDTLSLQYRNDAGELVSQRIHKGPHLGPVDSWVEHQFALRDAYFANNLTAEGGDFRISCNNDGDEYVHLVQVSGVWGEPPPLPPLPDTLLAAPRMIRLIPLHGVLQAVLEVENANPGQPIAWSASADRDWISLDQTSGTIPAEVMVTYIDADLAEGLHSGTITLTSSDLPEQNVQVTVEVLVIDAGLWLPMVTGR